MKRFTQCKVVWTGADTPEKRRQLVELAHLAGFYSVNMQFPASVSPADANDPGVLYLWPNAVPGDNVLPVRLGSDFSAQRAALFDELGRRGPFEQTACPPDGYRAASDRASIPVQPPHDGGLEDLFYPGFILFDGDHDGIADRVECRLLLPDDASEAQFRAACDLSARLGMETAGARFPLTLAQDDGRSHLIRFSDAAEPSVSLDEIKPRKQITVRGAGEALTGFMTRFCLQFPQTADHRTLYDAAQCLQSAVRMGNADGQAAVLAAVQGPA